MWLPYRWVIVFITKARHILVSLLRIWTLQFCLRCLDNCVAYAESECFEPFGDHTETSFFSSELVSRFSALFVCFCTTILSRSVSTIRTNSFKSRFPPVCRFYILSAPKTCLGNRRKGGPRPQMAKNYDVVRWFWRWQSVGGTRIDVDVWRHSKCVVAACGRHKLLMSFNGVVR